MADQEPTGELPPGFEDVDAAALDELARAGIGEGDFDGDDHGVPADLVELHEILEWQRATGER